MNDSTSPKPSVSQRARRVIGLFGWIGTLLILAAYFLNTRGAIEPSSTTYHLLNLVGAIGIAAVCALKRTWPPLFLNLVWAGIALHALLTPAAS